MVVNLEQVGLACDICSMRPTGTQSQLMYTISKPGDPEISQPQPRIWCRTVVTWLASSRMWCRMNLDCRCRLTKKGQYRCLCVNLTVVNGQNRSLSEVESFGLANSAIDH